MELLAKQIIENNTFLSLATSYQNNTWIAPVFYAHDSNMTFYFVSSLDSVHIRHIKNDLHFEFAETNLFLFPTLAIGEYGFLNLYKKAK